MWLLPAVVVVLALVPVAIAAFRAADEARELRRQLGGLAQLRPALMEVRAAGQELRARMQQMRRS
jgi:hypothetical protein